MSLRVRSVFFAVGLALAALVVRQVGVATLITHFRTAGWLLPPIVAVWGLVYLCDAAGWYIMLGPEAGRPGFLRTLGIHITSFTLNDIIPAGGFGGEGFRAWALAPWLGRQRAVSAVVQFRLLHSLAHMIFVLVALIPAMFLLPRTVLGLVVLVLTGVFGAVVAWFLHRRHQEGILEASLDLLLAIPGLRRLARRLEARRTTLRQMDAQNTTLYHEHPRRFWGILGVEFLSRCLMSMELALIFWGLGFGVRIMEALVAAALVTTLINLFFFLPLELGAREGGLYLVFALLGLGAEHGVFAAVVTRLRVLVWAGIGLSLLWLQGHRLPRPADQGPPSFPTPPA